MHVQAADFLADEQLIEILCDKLAEGLSGRGVEDGNCSVEVRYSALRNALARSLALVQLSPVKRLLWSNTSCQKVLHRSLHQSRSDLCCKQHTRSDNAHSHIFRQGNRFCETAHHACETASMLD
jgi:hypothetical protein